MKKLRKKLQQLIGPSPHVEVSCFTNWASTERAQVLLVTPATVEEVQAVVRGVRRLKLTVRAVGTGHSWSPLFADGGHVMMRMSQLERPDGPRIELLQNLANLTKKQVTVATGVTTAELKAFQLEYGVCLPTNVILGCVQMGGVISTGSHGAGWSAKTIGDYVVGVRLVDGRGELRQFTAEDNPQQLTALQCSLGMWGIIIDITFQVEPMVMVESENLWVKVKDVFYNQRNMQDLLHNNWSVQMFWFPFNGISRSEGVDAFMDRNIDLDEWDPLEDEVWVRLVNPRQRIDKLTSDLTYSFQELRSWMQMKGVGMIDDVITKFPHMAPFFLREQVIHLKSQFSERQWQQLPHAIHFLTNVEKFPVNEMEWAFVIDNDCSNVGQATQRVVELVRDEALNGRFPMNLPLELRFTADSAALLSPARPALTANGGTGHTCFAGVLTLAGTPGWRPFSQQVADLWSTLHGARPHWGKEWSHLNNIDTFIQQQEECKWRGAYCNSMMTTCYHGTAGCEGLLVQWKFINGRSVG